MSGDPSKEQAAAREEVMKCEKEIQTIKAALRRLGGAGNADEPNSVEVAMLKVEGLPEAAKPVIHLQLSSPIEEGTLSEMYDPNNAESALEGSTMTFKGVETANATLTVSAKDADIPLGSSTPHDLAPLCSIDPMNVKEEYINEVPVAIVADESKTESSEPILPSCTVTLRIKYKPSPKDQREELYEVLNKTSQRKATSLENLRKISMTLALDSSPNQAQTTIAKPSVKPGFLNKKQKEPTKLEQIYQRTLGPDSILRKSLGFAIATRNYFIFFGAVSIFHFKGQLLSLPPPV